MSQAEYRQHLVLAEQKAQDDFDKAVISLSGGGLGISFAFVDKFVRSGQPVHHWILFAAWAAWTASIVAVLLSYCASIGACRKAIRQVDAKTIHTEEPGGWFAYFVDGYNYAGLALFLLGVMLIVVFVGFNFGG
jgi:hypothetical protein